MSLGVKSLLALLLSVALAAPASAQFGPVGPRYGGVPLFQNAQRAPLPGGAGNQLGIGRLVNTPVVPGVGGGGYPGYSAVPQGSPYPPYSSPYSSYYDPNGGVYRGVGDLTLAYGQYIQDYQRGRLLNQEVERSKIDTRRRLYDEWRYYQSLQPTAEDIRIARIEGDLATARRQAPIGEVLAGKSLNVLLAALKTETAKGKRGPALALEEEMLKRVNVTPKDGVSISLIKTGRITWPLVLRDERFNEVREKLDLTLENAVNRAKLNGNVDAALMNQLTNLRRDLEASLDKIAPTLNMSQFMEAKRYMNWLGDGLRALEGTDVANFFNRKYEARGKTVGDLVEYMTREGLKFAPAVPGDEASYRMLYTLLAAYENAVQLVTR